MNTLLSHLFSCPEKPVDRETGDALIRLFNRAGAKQSDFLWDGKNHLDRTGTVLLVRQLVPYQDAYELYHLDEQNINALSITTNATHVGGGNYDIAIQTVQKHNLDPEQQKHIQQAFVLARERVARHQQANNVLDAASVPSIVHSAFHTNVADLIHFSDISETPDRPATAWRTKGGQPLFPDSYSYATDGVRLTYCFFNNQENPNEGITSITKDYFVTDHGLVAQTFVNSSLEKQAWCTAKTPVTNTEEEALVKRELEAIKPLVLAKEEITKQIAAEAQSVEKGLPPLSPKI